jgi:cobalt/nickel transport system ATP-binding protein
MNPGDLDIRDLTHTYPDGTRALDKVSFHVAAGEALAVLGANGAGKSTLLLHLNGCLLPQSGEVRVGGQVLARATLPAIRRAVGLVFQDPDDQLFMPSVAEDVAFGPRNMGLSPDAAARVAQDCLERVGMAHVSHRPPFRLSAGEKRAVSIAAALALEPEVLVLDEPSSNLDPCGRRRLMELLRGFEHTRLVATHDLELAVEVCPRALILDQGRVVAQGPTAELLNDEPRMLAHGLERPHILRHQHPHPPV